MILETALTLLSELQDNHPLDLAVLKTVLIKTTGRNCRIIPSSSGLLPSLVGTTLSAEAWARAR